MGYEERKKLYKEIEQYRGNPVLSYVTSIRPGLSTGMEQDVIPQIIRQIEQIPSDVEEINFLIVSNGGDPIVALRIVEILRQRFKRITALIPYVAYSAATVFALGADELIMHPFSNLGPVDPQIVMSNPNENGQRQFSSEDINNYFDFIKTDLCIDDPKYLADAFNSLVSEIGPISIGFTKRSQQLSLLLSKKNLAYHMKDEELINEIATSLNSSYFHHGYTVDRKEVEDMGLTSLQKSDPTIEKMIWDIWCDYNDEMKCDQPFDIVAEILGHNPNALDMETLNIPVGVGGETVVQLEEAVRSALSVSNVPPIFLDYATAFVESGNVSSKFVQTLAVQYRRSPNMDFQYNVTSFSKGWQ